MYYYEILVAHLYANKPYIYKSSSELKKYQIVVIEFSKNKVLGCVLSQTSQKIEDAKFIQESLQYILSVKDIEFITFFAKYYLVNIGAALDLMLPNAIVKKAPVPMLFERDGACISLDAL